MGETKRMCSDEALGFVVVGRAPVDDTGRPYPLLRMRQESPSG
jgi:hypothetical protein